MHEVVVMAVMKAVSAATNIFTAISMMFLFFMVLLFVIRSQEPVVKPLVSPIEFSADYPIGCLPLIPLLPLNSFFISVTKVQNIFRFSKYFIDYFSINYNFFFK